MTLQHFAGRGLLLQRFGELVASRLHFLEQPRVLDRDHRLSAKFFTSSICLSVNGLTFGR